MIDNEIELKKKKKESKSSSNCENELKKKKTKKKLKDRISLLEKRVTLLEKEFGINRSSKFAKFDKKSQFINKKKSNNKIIYIGAAFILIIALSVFLGLGNKKTPKSKRAKNVGVQTYSSNVKMTEIKAKNETNDIISIPLSKVERNLFVLFRYDKNKVDDRNFGKQGLPLLAYIAPSGDVITAVSMCEPCKSIRFHIESDNTLTCEACGTKFDMETLKGISGACTDYPPDEINYTMQNNKIIIDPSKKMPSGKTVATWKPRI